MSLKALAVSGSKWSSVSLVARRVLSLGTNIVLARLLAPSDFGLVAMAAVVLGFIELFRSLGTGSAIIQRRETSDALLSSLFWLNTGVGGVAAILILVGAPVAAWLYQEPRVEPVLQAMSIGFFITALAIVQSSLLDRALAFEKLAKIEIFAAVVASSTGIGAALMGFGVWSLVFQVLAGNICSTSALWLTSNWRPQFLFRWSEVRTVVGYSLNLTASNTLNFFVRNADNLLIGRFLGAEALGYYSLAYQLMLYPLQGLSAVISRVMFPLYSRIQDDNQRFRRIYLQVCGTIALIAFPMMLGIFAVREPMVLTVFGEKWLPVAALLAFFAPLGAIQALGTTTGSIFQSKGRTDLLFKWTIGASCVILPSFVIGLQWGVVGVAAAYTAASVLLLYPAFAIPFRLIDLPLSDLIKAVWRPIFAAIAMATAVMIADAQLPADLAPIARLLVLVPLGAVLYGAIVLTIDRKFLMTVVSTIRNKS